MLITADSDFAAMLALGGCRAPSVVLLRSADHMRPRAQAELLAANLATVGEELARGAIVSLTRRHMRVASCQSLVRIRRSIRRDAWRTQGSS